MRYLRLTILRERDVNQASDSPDYNSILIHGVTLVRNSTGMTLLSYTAGNTALSVRGKTGLELAASIMNLVQQLTEDFHPCEIAIMPNIQQVVCLPNIVYSQAKEQVDA